MGDSFKLLTFGVQFDKKRFGTDINLFASEKKPVAEPQTTSTPKDLQKSNKRQKDQSEKVNESKGKETVKRKKVDASIDDDIIENSHLDYVEFSDSDNEEVEGSNPWGGDDDNSDDGEGNEDNGEGDNAEVEYDFTSTKDWEGEQDGGEGDEDGAVSYFSTSKNASGKEENKGDKKKKGKKKVVDQEKWDASEEERTGMTVEQARDIRKKLKITVKGDEVPFPLDDVEGLTSIYGMRQELQDNMATLGYHTLTPVQQQAIPTIMCNREAVVCAPTGSGKTLCFALPVLHLLKEPKIGGARALILSPTRELTEQIYRHFKRLSVGIPFRYCLLTKPPIKFLKIDPIFDIIITTPSRLVFLIKNNQVDLTKIEYLVFDEADRLFDETFIEQVDNIVTACKNPQIKLSLLSATISPVVDELAKSVLKFPIDVHIGARNSAASTIDQQLVHVTESGKLLALRQLILKGVPPPVMIFVKSKSRAKYLYDQLASAKLHVGVSHSDLPPAKRSEVVTNFRIGKIWFLIATDLMSRGMDFKNVGCVINFDCPPKRTNYIHRIGRTGRAGQKGKAITFYSDKDMPFIRSIANVVKESGGVVPEWMNALNKQHDRVAMRVLIEDNKRKKLLRQGKGKGGKPKGGNAQGENSKSGNSIGEKPKGGNSQGVKPHGGKKFKSNKSSS